MTCLKTLAVLIIFSLGASIDAYAFFGPATAETVCDDLKTHGWDALAQSCEEKIRLTEPDRKTVFTLKEMSLCAYMSTQGFGKETNRCMTAFAAYDLSDVSYEICRNQVTVLEILECILKDQAVVEKIKQVSRPK